VLLAGGMIEAYFDESGTHHGSPLMCVAGYVIEAEQRRHFQQEWDAILAKHGIPYFHMSDCAHGAGVFARVPKSVRSEICRSLIELIKLRAELGIAVSVCESDYQMLAPPDFKIDAYSFCLHYCMQGVMTWANKFRIVHPISYFFESGHKNEAVANSLVTWLRGNQAIVNGLRCHSHSFVSGKRLCGIAAADLLAWEFHAAYRNKFGPIRRPVRLSFQNLMRLTHIIKHFKPEDLQQYFAESRAVYLGERSELSTKFRSFLSMRDLPEKPSGQL
jgi:hypothetical protein